MLNDLRRSVVGSAPGKKSFGKMSSAVAALKMKKSYHSMAVPIKPEMAALRVAASL
jgi:hypothetical protein